MMIIFVKIFNTFFNDKWDNNHGDNRNNNVSVFIGIGNNISICYKFQNDFNDYFQDKNNKNINGNNTVILIILDINNDKEIKVNFITDF